MVGKGRRQSSWWIPLPLPRVIAPNSCSLAVGDRRNQVPPHYGISRWRPIIRLRPKFAHAHLYEHSAFSPFPPWKTLIWLSDCF